ncbi:MAG: phosphoribosylformylglycinamidine synthase subunit PurL [Armatimonadetes bacterium]|nr:phosphoribosylformylglycinamidine synthase subunit PurL [Armatimonadota bacterium]
MQLDDRRVRVSELTDEQLAAELKQHGVGLTPFEARRIVELIGHDPTLTELHIFNVEWSEHCSYKSSRATLKEFLPTDAPNVILGPQEDAGIIELCRHKGRRYGVVIAHESHNHPSQVLPREGAATGIGGIVRDVDCMGARVIATGDPLRFGSLQSENVERTRWIVEGVVEGIWQYGNALGVPNLGGDVYFREAFDDNCLVNVVSLGIVAEEDIIHSAAPPEAAQEPYDLILVGKPTDDSGFGGSAFASKVLSEEEQAEDRAAVQVDDPFLKNVLAMRKANEAVREAAKAQGYPIGIKDLGGGGFACGSSEITAAGGFGVDIDLDAVHVGLENLHPETICCAETQERYVLAVPRQFTPEVLRIYNEDWDLPNVYEGACARVVGTFNDTQRYVIRHQGKIVCDAPVEAVTSGISYQREEKPREPQLAEPDFEQPADLAAALLKVLGHENVCSREFIYRAYDTEVQGNAVIRPGEADAGVCAPLEGSRAGVALAMDGNPAYGAISPYWAGANAVVEACRNVAAVGAMPAGLTDCLNYGNPETPTAFWEFREGVKGIADAARQVGLKTHPGQPVPVVSGNVSFYNESATGRAVEPSGIIACVGVMADSSQAVTMQLKHPGDTLYLVGPRYDECGGSAYYQALALGLGANVPHVRWDEQRAAIYGVLDAIDAGLVAACHDISDGGLAVALAEMALGGYARGKLGAEVDLTPLGGDLRADTLLFSESGGFVAEVKAGREAEFEALFAGQPVTPIRIGTVTPESQFRVAGLLSVTIADMAEAWTTGLATRLR